MKQRPTTTASREPGDSANQPLRCPVHVMSGPRIDKFCASAREDGLRLPDPLGVAVIFPAFGPVIECPRCGQLLNLYSHGAQRFSIAIDVEHIR